jgi:hypothetical protein
MRSDAVRTEQRPAFERSHGLTAIAWGGDGAAAAVAAMVAQQRNVPLGQLLHRSRREAGVAEARQLAMYLVHVVLGRTYSQVGDFFGRDRTTVAHACARIEDQRDRRGFDEEVAAFEAAIDGGSMRPAATEFAHAAG